MLKSRRFWIGIGLAALFLYLFIRGTDFSEMRDALSEANYIYLIPAIAVYFVGVYFRSVRWQYLLKSIGNFSAIRLFPLVVIGFLVNNVLPARLGIVARAYILGEKEGVSKMETGGTLVVEQVFDGLTLLLFAAVISFFVSLEGNVGKAVYTAAGLFIAALVILLVLASSERLSQKAIALLLRVLPDRFHDRVETWFNLLVDGLAIMRSPVKLLILLLISIFVWLFEASTFYVVSFAFNLDLSFHVFILAAAIANLAWALIMTQGGLGSFDVACKETIMLSAFLPAGVVLVEYESLVGAYTIVLHATLLIPMIALGFIFLWTENMSLAKIVQENRRLAQGDSSPPETEGQG